MAILSRTYRWEKFAPDLGENLSLPPEARLHLEIASGISAKQLDDVMHGLKAAWEAGRAEGDAKEKEQLVLNSFSAALEPVVRVVGTNSVAGADVRTLREYVGVVASMRGRYNLDELTRALMAFNSLEGTEKLFSERHSGGLLTTRALSAAKAGETTGAH